MFNPYTGTPRHPSDITSDPEGLMLLEPDTPVRPAQPEQQAEPALLAAQLRRLWINSPEMHKDMTYAAFSRVARLVEAAHSISAHPPAQPAKEKP